ncbi:hypothetical protein [Streptomyces sp. NPDC006691]
MTDVEAAGRLYPGGTVGVVIVVVALAVLAAMIMYGRAKRRRDE